MNKDIEYDTFIDWYWSVIIISFTYQFIWTNKIVYFLNFGLSYEVNDTGPSPLGFGYQSMAIEAITPIWNMVVVSVAVNYRYSRYKIDMKISIDNRYGFSDIDISSF